MSLSTSNHSRDQGESQCERERTGGGGNPERLITENLDVWSSAIKRRGSQGRGGSKKIELYGIKKLRELILELAVRGLLVPQDEHDEPASVLVKNIEKEREYLISKKKAKRVKRLPEISQDEEPYSLRKGWTWVRLQEIIQISSGNGLTSSKMNKEGDVPVYGGNGVTGCHSEGNVDKPTLIIGRVGFYCGSIHITPEKAWVTDNAFITTFSEKNIYLDFLSWLLKGTNLKENESATAQPVISGRKVYPIVVGLPPLAEQHRIVAKVDELMALCDQLEQQQENSISAHQTLVETLLSALTNAGEKGEFNQAWARIAEHFDTLFTTEHSIDQLKQAILQLAVMGKLVPQDPNDEPASVLLEKIAAEKAQLIKDGRIKKQKALPEIGEDEKPFELPEGWEWCRLPDIGDLSRGKSKHRPRNDRALYVDGNIPLVQTGDVSRANGVIETYTALYNKTGLAQSRLWPKGTMCITIAANIADTSVLGFDACFPDSVVGYTPFDKEIDVRYFEFFIRTAKSDLEKYAPSTAQKNINLEILSQVLVPFPPKEELFRVVAKIVKLMDLCDTLKERIRESQTTQLHLADAMAEQKLI
ncbi:restriction endonuclease subunit S [Alkalimarinus alittae]|uniref:Restriction endonuclease subunit S n=1 Tax=Alkalimarinus alittae TaxID=2961619 RepID=A0ABY6N6M6_9ALTE|nr:restriction endonuclease subunit S [Alkalimarinus alittae]UZE97639.1 restriction endonuclease subunit S [Alkalimarinus alittae]